MTEFKNNISKQHLGRKASCLPEFIESMKELLSGQLCEIEKAVPMYGEFRTVRRYSNLACVRKKWLKMSDKQRHSKISRIMAAPVEPNFGVDCSFPAAFSVDIEKVLPKGPTLSIVCCLPKV